MNSMPRTLAAPASSLEALPRPAGVAPEAAGSVPVGVAVHHCRRGWMLNLGAMFSVWDQLHGTYFEDWQLSANQLHQENVAVPVRRRRG